MRTAILSDIHGNLEALEAVLEECRGLGVRDYICLGDIVGYGASPNACVDRIRGLADRVVAGNHDLASVGLADLSFFSPVARTAAVWTARELSRRNSRYLRSLPLTVDVEDAICVHATPHEPQEWNYVYDARDAVACFAQDGWKACFLGHSHVAFICVLRNHRLETVSTAEFSDGCRYVVNVGSVGQPRDRDPRASFAVWDRASSETRVVRAAYDIPGAQARILDAGLPAFLADRLTEGR